MENIDGELEPCAQSVVIPHAYNDTRSIIRKRPIIVPNKSFKEQRASARIERMLKDRDHGGWAAEWARDQGDFKHWSNLTAEQWMQNRQKELQLRSTSSGIFKNERPNTASHMPKIDHLIHQIGAQARQNKAEIDFKTKMDIENRLGFSKTPTNFNQTGFRTMTLTENPSLLKPAGKTSTNISIEKNKKQLFENLENINDHISGERKQRPMTSVPQETRMKTPVCQNQANVQKIDRRRSATSQCSRDSHNSKQNYAGKVA
jgi:hypothetical protein